MNIGPTNSLALSRLTKPTSAAKPSNKHWDKRGDGEPGGTGSGKATVVGAVQRKGNVVARVIEHADTETLESFIREAVSNKVSLIAPMTAARYRKLEKQIPARLRSAHR